MALDSVHHSRPISSVATIAVPDNIWWLRLEIKRILATRSFWFGKPNRRQNSFSQSRFKWEKKGWCGWFKLISDIDSRATFPRRWIRFQCWYTKLFTLFISTHNINFQQFFYLVLPHVYGCFFFTPITAEVIGTTQFVLLANFCKEANSINSMDSNEDVHQSMQSRII